jgi:hypothetical protein
VYSIRELLYSNVRSANLQGPPGPLTSSAGAFGAVAAIVSVLSGGLET